MIISNTLYDALVKIESPENGDTALHSTYELPREFQGVVHDETILDVWDDESNSPIAARCIFLMEGRIIRVDVRHWDGRHETYVDA